MCIHIPNCFFLIEFLIRMEKEKVICPDDKNCNENILLLFKISSVWGNMLLSQVHKVFSSCQQIMLLKKFTRSITLPVNSPLGK